MQELSADIMQAALRPFRHFVCNDVDQARDRIASVFCQHSLVPSNGMQAIETRMDLLNVADLGFGSLRLGGAMSVNVPQMSDCYLMLFCVAGSSAVSSEGDDLTISGSRGFVCNPGQQFQARFSADAEQLFLRIHHETLWRHTGVRQLRFHSAIDLSRPALAPTDASIRMLLSDANTISLTQVNAQVAREYEQLFISMLLAGQPHTDRSQAGRSGIAPATVRRAEAFMRAHAGDPITLGQVAEAVGVPARTLLDGFRRFRDTSPMRLLRDIRLDLARDCLSRADGGSVAAVAMSCGFGHLGRFAQAYAARFAECPSETLARRRSVRPTRRAG